MCRMRTLFRKKAQFGPDALVGMVLVAVLGLGGIFFLNAFVNGIALEGMISILDTEMDQSCFYIMLPLVNDEYVRSGATQAELSEPIGGSATSIFIKQQDYFGGYDDNMDNSAEFAKTIEEFDVATNQIKNFPIVVREIRGFIADKETAGHEREKIIDEITPTKFCEMPVYSPAGKTGTAGIYIEEYEPVIEEEP